MSKLSSELRAAIFKGTILWVIYLTIVILIVSLGVLSGNISIGRWPYFIFSGIYLIIGFYICIKEIHNGFVAIIVAVISISVGLFAAMVLGVNFNFLIGGSM